MFTVTTYCCAPARKNHSEDPDIFAPLAQMVAAFGRFDFDPLPRRIHRSAVQNGTANTMGPVDDLIDTFLMAVAAASLNNPDFLS